MTRRRLAALLALPLAVSACTSTYGATETDVTATSTPSDERPTTTSTISTTSTTATTTTASSSTTSSSTGDPSTTSSTTIGAEPTTSTSTTAPLPAGIFDPACARLVQPGESLSLIADGVDDPTVTGSSLQTENGIADPSLLRAGAVLDMCPGNGIDDLTGVERPPTTPAVESSGVAAQQRKLNELFAGTGLPALAVDGVAGPFTRQQLCASRLALNLPVSRDEMAPGSAEELALLSATAISVPATAAVSAGRWILIDKTCQVLFAGDGGAIAFVYKTSTGEPGWETRDHAQVGLYRYNPALENGGWHNSSKFPVPEDNPLNGNMYKPLYFDGGQAIHGANNVPPTPASKGCARLRPEHQDALITWLGLADVTEQLYDDDRISAAVTVQGAYVP